MTKYIKNLLVFVLIAFVLSCQKKDNTPADLSKVTVAFISPVQGQVYHKNDTIQINTDVSYIGEIAGIGVQIKDSVTDSLLFEDNQDTHTGSFAFHREWVDTCSAATTLQVKILVFVANNTAVPAERSVYIKSLP